MITGIYHTVNEEKTLLLTNLMEKKRKEEKMLNGGMLLILLLLLIYTFGGDGALTTENLTLIVLALSFLVAENRLPDGCGCENVQ